MEMSIEPNTIQNTAVLSLHISGSEISVPDTPGWASKDHLPIMTFHTQTTH